ncbi:excalibur calcium-binding domain-containing protein [Sphingomonas arenae]|uniref:excalibur calcium-binding domain-containing protein n=1 Tax=Sphingomonas arenae TaxID=2812555 RepID=UPI001F444DB0|nr:excalibur calcium-binding domain-containing protein [Sphingomonas arenae]
MRIWLLSLAILLPIAEAAVAHPGDLNAQGCHNNRKTGDYHSHGGRSSAATSEQSSRKPAYSALGGGGTYYANCSAARAAGAAPVRAGDPGYSRKLDRDGDGVACE